MNKLSKILTCWIPIKNIRKRARQELELFLYNLIPLNDNWVVFYDTFSRSGNGDSIRPIAKELKKRNINLKFFFVAKSQMEIDMADEVLVENSERFNYVVQRAKFIISPLDLPKIKHKNQFWIMTWHGSPIKKIYLSRDKNNSNFIEYVSKFKNVDVFCNQSEVHEKILLEAFNISKSQILNCGLPRNDILFQNNQELKIKLKQKMCIPEHKKIILYCPTWRRYDKKANLPFNLDNMREKLSDNYIIILRSHVGKHSWVDSDNNPINIFDNKFCFDGSCVQEVTDLYLISDLMISDYSSSIFDFAITEKPQILYIYDYENYKNEFGLYYDYNTFAPFPKVKTEEELINIIKNYNNNDINYTQFKQDYLFFEKGTASKQIADLIFKIARN